MAEQVQRVAAPGPVELQRYRWRRGAVEPAIAGRLRCEFGDGVVEGIVGDRHDLDGFIEIGIDHLGDDLARFEIGIQPDFAQDLAIADAAFMRQQAGARHHGEAADVADRLAGANALDQALCPAIFGRFHVDVAEQPRPGLHVAVRRHQVEIGPFERCRITAAARPSRRRQGTGRHGGAGQGQKITAFHGASPGCQQVSTVR